MAGSGLAAVSLGNTHIRPSLVGVGKHEKLSDCVAHERSDDIPDGLIDLHCEAVRCTERVSSSFA